MAELDDLFAHRGKFKPQAPASEADVCKCPECGKTAAFSDWLYHRGLDSGVWCDDCNDFHSCFECPNCHEFIGAAGTYNRPIEVAVSHE